MTTTKTPRRITGWHFAGKTLRDGRPLPKRGETLKHDGEVIPCESGLHASKRAIDALNYAPGNMVARVRLSGTIVPHGKPVDKYAASERTNPTDYVDATDTLREFARLCALRAARVYAADAMEKAGLNAEATKFRALPDSATPNEIKTACNDAWAETREAARAARAAARVAAWAAAQEAAWATARAAASEAARAAASEAENKFQNMLLEAMLNKLTRKGNGNETQA